MATVTCEKCYAMVPESMAYECYEDVQADTAPIYICDECFDCSDATYYDEWIEGSELVPAIDYYSCYEDDEED